MLIKILLICLLGISKFCHTSELLRLKLTFIENLKIKHLSYKIFSTLLNNVDHMNPKSKSFIGDYRNISGNLGMDSEYLLNNINKIIIE